MIHSVFLVWDVPEFLAPNGVITLNHTSMIPILFLVWDVPEVLVPDGVIPSITRT